MRALLPAALILLLAISGIARAQDYCVVAKAFGGSLHVYSLNSSGEIFHEHTTAESSGAYQIQVDLGGRIVAVNGHSDILLFRVEPDRMLTLASTIIPPEYTYYWTPALGMSQDGRFILGLFGDQRVNPTESFYHTFLVNNRLEMIPTGFTVPVAGEDLNVAGWSFSDRSPYTAALRMGVPHRYRPLRISTSGEMTNPDADLAMGFTINGPLEFSSDGEWGLVGQQSGTVDAGLVRVDSQGLLTLHDTVDYPSVEQVFENRLWPSLRGVLLAGQPTLVSVALNPDMTFGEILDTENVGTELAQGLAISHDGRMVVVEDQVGSRYPMASFFLDPDTGELTPTGHSIDLPGIPADLRFIPPPTLPTLAGDANVDGVVDAADVVFLINEAMPDDKPILYPQNFANVDLDNDIDVDQDDLDGLIEMLLGL